MNRNYNNKQRITQRQKDANDKQWYKDQADSLDGQSFSEHSFIGFGGVSDFKRKKVNYDLFNNRLNLRDFEYVCKPYGASVGELPATLTNRDIISGKIKVLLGMEMKMPFSWKVIATNEEATTRKEQHETDMIKDYVTKQIMAPIKTQIEQEALMQANGGRALTPQEKEEIQAKIAQETEARTPDEVRKYMLREHQDPTEKMMSQILEYLIEKERIADKFNRGFKHASISGEEIYGIHILNGEPSLRVVNPLYFDYGISNDLEYIEDSEWAVEEINMTPSAVIADLGSELTDEQIDRIYEFNNDMHTIQDADFSFDTENPNSGNTVRVKHITWKSLRKIGFLSYVDRNGRLQMKMVDENYDLTESQGDVEIDWMWIPEVHECYKILSDIYVHCRPVPGQHTDIDDLYTCKLPYYGAAHDSLNSPTTSPMDRMKAYQYYFNIILYRIELLIASDKGKILMANINAIPNSAGIDTKHFMYFLDANKIGWLNPQEEGNKGIVGGDVTNLVKQVDMSLTSQIADYISIAEYIERKCGESIGVTKQMEGAIGPNEAVTNTRQNLVQSSHIIQPYFELHNMVKGNVLNALVQAARVAYSDNPRKLSYVLDDMSVRRLETDPELISGTRYGLFISNSQKAEEARQAVINLSQAALQNQQASLSDVIKVIKSNSITQAEELLEMAEDKSQRMNQQLEQQKMQAQQQLEAKKDQLQRDEWAHEKDLLVTKEKMQTDREIQKQTILSMGFDPNKDEDGDGTPDVLEVAKLGVDADIKLRKLKLDQDKLDQKTEHDKEKLKLEAKKIAAQKNKPTTK